MKTIDFVRDNAPFLAAGFLQTFASAFGQTFFISLFAGEIRETFALSHAAWGGIYAGATLCSAVVMVWAGGLTDAFRVRRLGVLVIFGMALACLTMALSPNIAVLAIAIFLLRLMGQGMMSHLSAVAMARWFVATRGKALSIAGLGFSVAEASLPVAIVLLLAWLDWHVVWFVAAGFALVLLPILLRLLRLERTPQSMGESHQSTGLESRHWTRNEVLRHRLFWFLIPILLGPSAFNTAFFFQQVHFVEVKGWSHLQLVSLFPIYTLIGIGAMMASGFVIDRFGATRSLPFYQLPMAVAFVIFATATTPVGAMVGLFFLALGTGANSTLPSAFWAETYGTAHLGRIRAMATAVMVLGSAIGPGMTGALISAGVGIESQYIGVGGYFVLACCLAWVGIRQVSTTAP